MDLQSCEGVRVLLKDGVFELTLDRPEVGNAVLPGMVPDLVRLLRGAAADEEVRCVVIQGAGKHLSTGGDLQVFAAGIEAGPEALQRSFSQRLAQTGELVQALLGLDRPVVARCRGVVAGAGLMFALAADWVIADPSAQFMFSHGRMGLSPDGGVSYLLPRLVGRRLTAQLVLGAAVVKAQDAVNFGLVSRLVPAEELDGAVTKFAQELANGPQLAMRTAKRLIDASSDRSLSAQLEAERQGIVQCVGHPDFAEGVTAFLGKRPPRFS